MGCKNCIHDHWNGFDRICDLNPHDRVTPEQLNISKWLCTLNRDAFNDQGCPSFQDYRKNNETPH